MVRKCLEKQQIIPQDTPIFKRLGMKNLSKMINAFVSIGQASHLPSLTEWWEMFSMQ